jgi:(S)-2-hydroxyglutarate dehydrogenase
MAGELWVADWHGCRPLTLLAPSGIVSMLTIPHRRVAKDAVIVGGGVVGLATALALLAARPGASVVVLEKEAGLGAHQTGHNSGVIHAGLYYKPGSLKATTCARGRGLLERFCEEHGVRFERCGKVVLATRSEEVARLDELERRGRANGLTRIRRMTTSELREREPHAAGVAALLVLETGIVDYSEVVRAYAAEIARRGGEIATSARVTAIERRGQRIVADSTAGAFEARVLVACAGLESDRIARLAGVAIDVAIVPFRGEYWMLAPARSNLVRHLIYPVPDPRFPFLGVHFTRRIGGGIEAGPNAVLALKREGYGRLSFDARDARDIALWPGFWRMARKHWENGLREQARSLSRRAFARACAALVPEVTPSDLLPGGAGVRAQAVARDGALVDDFVIAEGERMVHTLNAPSPAATASLAIGEEIAGRALRWL